MNNLNPTTKSEYKALSIGDQQHVLDCFVRKYVYTSNETLKIEFILACEHQALDGLELPFTQDEITNWTRTADIEIKGEYLDLDEDERDEKLAFYEYLLAKYESYLQMIESKGLDVVSSLRAQSILVKTNDIEIIIETLNEADFYKEPEVYQWFSCNSWFVGKLDEQGECTLEGSYWGRQCYGQSISLDNVIERIYLDLLEDV